MISFHILSRSTCLLRVWIDFVTKPPSKRTKTLFFGIFFSKFSFSNWIRAEAILICFSSKFIFWVKITFKRLCYFYYFMSCFILLFICIKLKTFMLLYSIWTYSKNLLEKSFSLRVLKLTGIPSIYRCLINFFMKKLK